MGQLMVIEEILAESRDLYQGQYDELIGRLIQIPRGSLRNRQVGGTSYWYLRRHLRSKGYEDVYIGPVGDRSAEALVQFVRERKKRIDERNTVKQALKALGVTRVEFQEKGYHRMFAALADAFGRVGLWDEGLMLIGSWCFNVYVQVLGVAFFPLRTMDFDFGLRIPFTGDKTNVDQLLRELGFSAKIDPGHDKIDYVLPGVGVVEVFIDRGKATPAQVDTLKRDLSIRPAAVSFLQILIDHPVTVPVRGIHKAITVPSMPAFFVHRLVTAKFGEYRDTAFHAAKIRKDYKQAALVAKRIASDEALQVELADIISELSDDLRQKMRAGATAAEAYIKAPDLTEEDILHIQRLATADK